MRLILSTFSSPSIQQECPCHRWYLKKCECVTKCVACSAKSGYVEQKQNKCELQQSCQTHVNASINSHASQKKKLRNGYNGHANQKTPQQQSKKQMGLTVMLPEEKLPAPESCCQACIIPNERNSHTEFCHDTPSPQRFLSTCAIGNELLRRCQISVRADKSLRPEVPRVAPYLGIL